MRITARFPWILLWIAKNLKMAGRRLLRGACPGSRNVLTVRKRASPGGDLRNVGGAGRPVPRTGAWPRRAARGAGKAGRLASRCGEAGQGPSISYMEGPCLILPGRNAITGTSTGPGTARRRPPECATAIIRGHDRGRARSLSGCAACPVKRRPSVPAFVHDLIRARSSRPACRACHASPGALVCCRLPARRQD
jgi:hypothetical protein